MSLSNNLSKRLAIWAIDPYENEVKPKPNAIEELKHWSNQLNMEIYPLYILHVPKSELHPHDTFDLKDDREETLVKKNLMDYVKDFHIPLLKDPQVIPEDTSSLHKQVVALIQYALKVHAEWIIVSSKGQSGFSRMALGSFAETLLLHSPLPVWAFGHGNPPQSLLSKVLFPTDFSDTSKQALKEVTRQAKETHSEIILYHKVTLPQATQIAMLGNGIPMAPTFIDDYFRDQRKWAEETAHQWVNQIKMEGVQVQCAIDTGIGQISESILEYSKISGAETIAIASHSNPVAAAFLGSTAREVIRKSHCPVWVFGPKYLVHRS